MISIIAFKIMCYFVCSEHYFTLLYNFFCYVIFTDKSWVTI